METMMWEARSFVLFASSSEWGDRMMFVHFPTEHPDVQIDERFAKLKFPLSTKI
jgi:hypothetical protein